MEFQNAGIDTSHLPKAAELSLQPVDPNYLAVLRAQWAIGWLFVALLTAIAIYFSEGLHSLTWIIVISLAVIVVALLNWWLVKRSFEYKAFAIREHDIVYRTGWLVQSTRVCPFNRIQHCSVDIGLFERKYGLATLSVYTAGGNEADMKIPGLQASMAGDLRELIIRKTGIDESTS